MKIRIPALIPISLFISCCAFAHQGGGGGGGYHGASNGGYHGTVNGGYHGTVNGGYHGNSGYNNNGGYHNNNGYNNGYHNNNVWYGGGGVDTYSGDGVLYDDGLNDDDSTNIVIGVPDGGYYDPSCQTVQTCNTDGECITQQNCN